MPKQLDPGRKRYARRLSNRLGLRTEIHQTEARNVRKAKGFKQQQVSTPKTQKVKPKAAAKRGPKKGHQKDPGQKSNMARHRKLTD